MSDPDPDADATPAPPWWGGACSSTQAEGAAPGTDWARWEQAGRAPASGQGNGFATRAGEDLALLVASGLPRVRLSVDWARLEPAAGRVDGAEVERWAGRLASARADGAQVWLGLHHVSLPGWFLDEGGFADDRARGRFWARHVDRCGELFGDAVAGWFPIDEPSRWADAGHRRGRRPPGRSDPSATADALRGIVLAWRDAWRQLRGGGPPVATSLDLPLVRTGVLSDTSARERRLLEQMTWGLWTTALRDGILSVPGRADEEVADLQGAADIVGFTYRGPFALGEDAGRTPWPADARRGATGDTYWPEGLGEVLHRLADELPDRALLLARVGVATPDDEWRADVLRALDEQLRAAASDGIAVQGAFYGSVIDAYEWEHGFTVPVGLFDRDRNPRTSLEVVAAR